MAFINETGLERLWQHIIAKLGTKADASTVTSLQAEVDELEDKKASVQFVTWEDGD
jgi:FtsZ-binding cell division protein ZapB